MKKTIRIAKALTDPNRLRALAALRQGELCVCQLIELLGLVPSTVSKHMSILRDAELVEGEKRGKWMYYSLPPKKSNPAVSAILKWVIDQIENDSVVMRDGCAIRLRSHRMRQRKRNLPCFSGQSEPDTQELR